MADDFRQYYLGAFTRIDNADPECVTASRNRSMATSADVRRTGASDNPLNEAGVFQPTSDVLPVAEFPQFASQGAAEYTTSGVDPYAPIEGTKLCRRAAQPTRRTCA